METYHKIQTLFKRHLDGPKKGKMIRGEWSVPSLEYLADNQWEFTEKVDGTNIRIGHGHRYTAAGSNWAKGVEFAGRSDNAQIPKPLMRHLEETFTAELFEKADLHENPITLFGEGYGYNIQNGGNYNSKEQKFVLFDVKIGDFWLLRKDVDDIAAKLGIESVPTIGYGTLHDAIDIVSTGLTWDKYGKMTRWGNSKAMLKSAWGDFEAEGIVARPLVPLFDRQGMRIITKIKAVDFR